MQWALGALSCSVYRQFVAALSELQSPPGATPPQLVGYSCQGQAAQNCGAWIVILEVGRGGPGAPRALDTGQFRFWSKFKVLSFVQKRLS